MNDAMKKLAKDASKIEELRGTLVLEILQALADADGVAEDDNAVPPTHDENVFVKLNPYEKALHSLLKKKIPKQNTLARKINDGFPVSDEELGMFNKLSKTCDALKKNIVLNIVSRTQRDDFEVCDDGTITFIDSEEAALKYAEEMLRGAFMKALYRG